MKLTFIRKKIEELLSHKPLIAILLVGFLIRFFPLRLNYHFWDETVYLQHAEIIDGLSPNNYNEFDFRPPLFSILLAAVFLISNSFTAAHLLVATLSTSGILLTFILGRSLFNKRVGLIASLIYLFSETSVRISHEILVDPFLPVFWLLVVISTLKIIRKEKKIHYILTGIFTGLAILLKFTSLLLIPVVAVVLLVNKIEELEIKSILLRIKKFLLRRRFWLYPSFVLITLSPYLTWSFFTYGSPLYTFKTGLKLSGAPDSSLTYMDGFSTLFPLPFLLGAVFFILKLEKWRKPRVNLPIIFSFSLAFALQYLIPNKELRFMLPALPSLFIIAAAGLDWFRGIGKKRYLVLILALILLTSLSLPNYRYVSDLFEGKFIRNSWWPPIYKASLWLKNRTPKNVVVYTNHHWPALGYYSKRKIVLLPVSSSNLENVLNQSGYICHSEGDPQNRKPDLDLLKEDSRFMLNKTFDGTRIFYYKAS